MGWFSKKHDEDDYTRGYEAAKELTDMLEEMPSDEEIEAQWDAVESGHSKEYVAGYAEYFLEDRPWWKVW